MWPTSKVIRFAAPLLSLPMTALPAAQAAAPTSAHEQASEELAYIIGVQAALWGRPLVEYASTTFEAVKIGGSYLDYFRKFDSLKTAAYWFVVTPNNVSIDGYAAADLCKEPVVLSVPSLQVPRWYIVQVEDMFDEVAYDVAGYKGAETGLYLVTGPDYTGPVPANMRQIKVRTQLAVVALRVFVQGEADLPGAREVQQAFHLLPLSVLQANGLKYTMPTMDAAPLQAVLSAPEPIRMFDQIGAGMKMFLSANADYTDPLVMSFRPIGLSATNGFDWKSLDEPAKIGLARAALSAEKIIDDAYLSSAEVVNGWRYTMSAGRAGGTSRSVRRWPSTSSAPTSQSKASTRTSASMTPNSHSPAQTVTYCTSTRGRFPLSLCSGTSPCATARPSSSRTPPGATASEHAERPQWARTWRGPAIVGQNRSFGRTVRSKGCPPCWMVGRQASPETALR